MKKFILIAGIFLAGVFFANAQDKTDAKATKLVNRITQICSLTPDQVTKVQPLAEEFIKAREANKQQYANDPDGLKNANKATTKSYKAKLDAIITPEQQQKLKEANEQRKAKMKNGSATQSEEQ
jgi:Spy/CpxP family protein refolding chaperone